MRDVSYGRVAAISTAAGFAFALGVICAVAARTAYTVTRGRRWYQLRQL